MAQLQAIGGTDTKQRTLTERLNDVYNALENAQYRVEAALSRANGTPGMPGATSAAPTPQFGLVAVVEKLEESQRKATELAAAIERIA